MRKTRREPQRSRSEIMDPDPLSPREQRFLLALAEGMRLGEAYRVIVPTASRRTATEMGSRLYCRIRKKADYRDQLLAAGLGMPRLFHEVEKRLTAMQTRFHRDEVVTVEDNTTRMRATELLAQLNGATSQDVVVSMDKGTVVLPVQVSPEQWAKMVEGHGWPGQGPSRQK